MLVHWIWFSTRPGVNDREKLALLHRFSDPERIFFADDAAFDQIDRLSDQGKTALKDKNLDPAETILADCLRERIHVLTYQDAAYPRRLQNISDPPMVLYYKGQLPELDAYPVIAVVGTRKASFYGLTTAKRMGYQIGRCGGIVVSGMAWGIDGLAMAGALTSGQPVVGVLGCGVDIVYPPSNQSLFEDTERYGCILSEFPPGTPPAKWTFPKRNRIISGLSCGVLVVEAPETSGALITARQAADQGRDVFVVPGNIDMPSFVGSNRLLRDGAAAVSSGWDVVSEYEALYPGKIHRDTGGNRQTAYPDEVLETAAQAEAERPKAAQKPRQPDKNKKIKKNLAREAIDKEASESYSGIDSLLDQLSEEEKAIAAALKAGERLVDDIIAETGLTTGKMLANLTMLELKGVIQRLPGKRVKLK